MELLYFTAVFNNEDRLSSRCDHYDTNGKTIRIVNPSGTVLEYPLEDISVAAICRYPMVGKGDVIFLYQDGEIKIMEELEEST